MIQHFLPPPDPSISPPREVILLVDLGDGNRRVLSCDADVQELIDRQGGRCEFIDVEVRELFPGSPTAVGPAVAASRSLRLPIAAFARPGRNVPSSPPSEGSRRGMHGGRPRPRSAGASFSTRRVLPSSLAQRRRRIHSPPRQGCRPVGPRRRPRPWPLGALGTPLKILPLLELLGPLALPTDSKSFQNCHLPDERSGWTS